jgi:hypothetical protein
MRKGEPPGVQGEAFAFPVRVPVFGIPDNRAADAREVNPDLVFPPREQGNLEHGALAAAFADAVAGVGKFPCLWIPGLIDFACGIFRQMTRNRILF